MASYKRCEIFSKNGDLLWSGEHQNRLDAINKIEKEHVSVSLGHILGAKTRIDKSVSPTEKEIIQFAVENEYINTDNNVPGFITVLPKAKIIQRIVEAINEEHYQLLNACEITFPTIYDNSSEDFIDLTKSYANEARIFSVDEHEKGLKLAYAADPGLFSWLKNKTFNKRHLPLAISSELNVLRKYKSGELGGFPTLREFPMPDLHIICEKKEALLIMCKNLSFAAEKMKKYFSDTWVFSMDITEEILKEEPNLINNVCTAIGSTCVINTLSEKPRYYSIKTVFLMDAGERSIMNYNVQWDEENPKRFNIKSDSGEPLVIIHGTLMHSWYKVLPVYINKFLTYGGDQLMPLHFAPIQLMLVILDDIYRPAAEEIKSELMALGIRCQFISCGKKLSNALSKIKKYHIPFFSIVGEKESKTGEYAIKNTISGKEVEIDKFKKQATQNNAPTNIMRLGRCDIPPPFVNIKGV